MSFPTLELVSHPLCPYVHRAAALLTERGVPFTTRHVDLQNKPDWFRRLSPRGKVPVLVVDGVAIFESTVILEFLEDRFALHLLPDDPLDRARERMWTEISNDLMSSQYKLMTAATPADRRAAVTSARDTLGRFDAAIVGPWFSGEALGLVDFAAGPALVRFRVLEQELGLDLFAGLPRAAAWAEQISARPAFHDTLVADFPDRLRSLIIHHDVAA